MDKTFKTTSEAQTKKIAADLISDLQSGDVLCLYGDLGAGKSVFARSLIRSLSGDPDLNVPSPTFTLVQSYDTKHGQIWHCDFYRLEIPEEVFELGWDDIEDNFLTLIEWPQKIAPYLPENCIKIEISEMKDHRVIKIVKNT